MKAWNAIIWSDDMISFLKENFNKKTNQQLADSLGLKLTVVRIKCYELGLKRMELEHWIEPQIDFLKQNYKSIGDTEIAEIFNSKYPKNKTWTKKHIEKKRRYLGLKRDAEDLKKIKQGWKEKGIYKEANRKMWETRGVKTIGTIVKWGIKTQRILIKTEEGYKFLLRYVWEQHFGTIEKGYNIYLKDGNYEAIKTIEDVKIENLMLVKDCEQAVINRVPNEYKELKLKIFKIKNQIKKIEKL